MKKVKGYVSTRYVGSRRDFEFEVEDDTPESDIEDLACAAMFEEIEWGYVVESPGEEAK